MTGTRTIAAIVVAAGRGERASAGGEPEPKQYRALQGEAVLRRTIRAFLASAVSSSSRPRSSTESSIRCTPDRPRELGKCLSRPGDWS